MIGHLSLGLNGRRPFGTGLNGHRPPETGGHLGVLQRLVGHCQYDVTVARWHQSFIVSTVKNKH